MTLRTLKHFDETNMILHTQKHTLKKKGDRSSDLIASKLQSDRLPPTHCKPEKCPPSKLSEFNFKTAETFQK